LNINPFQRKIFWGGLVLGVLVVSLLPQTQVFIETPFSDKIDHFLAYFILSFVALLASTEKHSVFMILIAHILLGIGIEVAQSFVPGRYMEVLDGVANTIGVGFGAVLYFVFRKVKPKNPN